MKTNNKHNKFKTVKSFLLSKRLNGYKFKCLIRLIVFYFILPMILPSIIKILMNLKNYICKETRKSLIHNLKLCISIIGNELFYLETLLHMLTQM